MKTRYKILIAIAVLIAISVIVAVFLPWKTALEGALISALEKRGLQGIHFTLSEISPQRAVLHDVTLGKGQALTLKNLVIRYSRQGEEIFADAEGLSFGQGGLKANAPRAAVHTKNGEGEWSLEGLQVQAGSVMPPVIAGSGKVKTGGDMLLLDGALKSKDGGYRADFSLDYPSAQLKLMYASMPWNGGTLTTRDVVVPLSGQQPVNLVLQIRQVSTDALLQAMTGKRVTATGTVSGSLPLVVERDGMISFGAGLLRADGAGQISLPPEAIPESGEQVGIVRDILKNFHYNGLSIDVNSDKNRGLSLLIALEGNNPDMYNGRPVKLNVHLAGDVLGYIRQNVLLLTSPETLLKQDQK